MIPSKRELYNLVECEVRKGLLEALSSSSTVTFNASQLGKDDPNSTTTQLKQLSSDKLSGYTEQEAETNRGAILGDKSGDRFDRNQAYLNALKKTSTHNLSRSEKKKLDDAKAEDAKKKEIKKESINKNPIYITEDTLQQMVSESVGEILTEEVNEAFNLWNGIKKIGSTMWQGAVNNASQSIFYRSIPKYEQWLGQLSTLAKKYVPQNTQLQANIQNLSTALRTMMNQGGGNGMQNKQQWKNNMSSTTNGNVHYSNSNNYYRNYLNKAMANKNYRQKGQITQNPNNVASQYQKTATNKPTSHTALSQYPNNSSSFSQGGNNWGYGTQSSGYPSFNTNYGY